MHTDYIAFYQCVICISLPINVVFPLDHRRDPPKSTTTCQALKLCAAKDPWKVIYTKADRNNKAALT